jgi:hypothetical protein
MRNENGYSGVVMGVFILVCVVVGIVGFFMITNEFNIQYGNAIKDPVNNTGILLNNTSAYEGAKTMSTAASDNAWLFILLAFVLVLLLIFGYIYNMSQS